MQRFLDPLKKTIRVFLPQAFYASEAAESWWQLLREEKNKSAALDEIIGILNEIENNREIDVITISANNLDNFIQVDRIAIEHESQITDQVHQHAGGSGANTICGLANLGKKAAIIGCISNDNEGTLISRSLTSFSVDTEFLITGEENPSKTGITFIIVEESSKRQILVRPGINDNLSDLIKSKYLEKAIIDKIKQTKILHLSSFVGAKEMEFQEHILESTKEIKKIVSFTPGSLYVKKGLGKLTSILAKTNLLFLYVDQLDELLRNADIEKIKKRFRDDLSTDEKIGLFFEWKDLKQFGHPMILVVKDGSKINANVVEKDYISVASSYKFRKSFFGFPDNALSPDSNPAIDSTGTGDAVAAGFLYGVLEKREIQVCTNFAFKCATSVSTAIGARTILSRQTELN
jgi:ribokinase